MKDETYQYLCIEVLPLIRAEYENHYFLLKE